ncbi:MAG: ComEA family DNA-binding protein [Desulforhopalus sp.]
MKSIHMLLAMMLTCSLSLAALPGLGFAKATKSTVTESVATEQTNKVMGEINKEININTADQQLLTQIKGVGPSTARKIIDYRKENGEFKSIDDLMNVKGIGEKSLAKMRPYLQKI